MQARALAATRLARQLLLLLLLLASAQTVASDRRNATDHAQALHSLGNAEDPSNDNWTLSPGSGFSFSAGGASSSSSSGHIAFVPARVDLGRVTACEPRSFFVSVENRGPRRVRLQRADFTRADLALATDVAGIHLDPGGRFLVELRFLPGEPAAHVGAWFRVLTSAGRFALPIHSRVVPNPAGVKALQATVAVGASVKHTIAVRNPRTSPLRVTDVFTLEQHLHLSFPGDVAGIASTRSQDEQYNDQDEHLPGVWEFEPGEIKPLVTLAFRADEPGDFVSYVNINADGQPFAVVPVRMTVLNDRELTVEPKVVDVGVLTSRQPHRHVVAVYNTLSMSVRIKQVHATATSSKTAPQSVKVSVRMVEEPFELPSTTRTGVTLELEFPDRNTDSDNAITPRSSGDFDISVTIETSAVPDDSFDDDEPSSAAATPSLAVRIVGKVLHGELRYLQRDTMFALTLPLTRVIPPVTSKESLNEPEVNVSIPMPMSVAPTSGSGSAWTVMEGGARLTRMFQLQNQFDAPLELQRAYIDEDNSADGESTVVREVTLKRFNQSAVAASGEFWPELELDISPSLELQGLALQGNGELMAPRAYSLVVETNATSHRIPLHLYHGIVGAQATRGLSRHALSGYVNESTGGDADDWMKTARTDPKAATNTSGSKRKSHKKKTKKLWDPDSYVFRTCASVYGVQGHTTITDASSESYSSKQIARDQPSEPPNPFNTRVCRSLQFDLGTIAIRGDARASETLTISNWNPIPIEMALSRVPQPELFTVDIHAEMSTPDGVDKDQDSRPDALSMLRAQWQANASFARSNERRLASLNALQHGDIAEENATSSPFVVPPGHSITMRLDVKPTGKLGIFTAHVLSLRTRFEVVHMHAFLDIVDGIVEPVQAEIELQPSFAGQQQLAELRYRNTFKHAVRITNVTAPNGFQIDGVGQIIPAKSEVALAMRFEPAEIHMCAGRRMVADCLLPPLDVPIDDDNSDDRGRNVLTGFGLYVNPSDLAALARRNDFWAQVASLNDGAAVLRGAINALVEIKTDLMRDVQPLTISIPLARPSIVVAGVSPFVDGDGSTSSGLTSSVPVEVRFPMTQLFFASHAFVNVTNPSNATIDAELVCAYTQRQFFYMCSTPSDDEADDGDMECLAEWRALVLDAASSPTCGVREDGSLDEECASGLVVDAPLFSFRHQVVPIPPGEHALLGPIYYLPGYKHQVSAELYVRNQLSHIEPIRLVASSGKPMLDLTVLSPVENGVSVTNHSDEDAEDELQHSGRYHNTNVLEFAVDGRAVGDDQVTEEGCDPRSTGFSRRANLQIANTGDFDLKIHKVWMVDRASDSTGHQDDELEFEIVAFPGHITLWRSKETGQDTLVVGENGAIAVLPPRDRLFFGIVFHPTCRTATTRVKLFMETNDDTRVIPLVGSITAKAAFECRSERSGRVEQLLLLVLWAVSVLAGAVCVLLVLADVVTTGVVPLVFSNGSKWVPSGGELDEKKTAALSAGAAVSGIHREDSNDNDSDVSSRLREMEQMPFKPSLPVELAAVDAVLQRRQRSVYDPATILRSLGGTREKCEALTTLEAALDSDAVTSRAKQASATDAESDASSKLTKTEIPPVSSAATAVVAVASPTAASSSSPAVRSTPATEAEEDLAASSHSTATVKSVDSEAESRAVDRSGQDSSAVRQQVKRDEQPERLDAAGIDGETDTPVTVSDFAFSPEFPSLKAVKDRREEETESPAWSLWGSKALWQSSAENTSLESNRLRGVAGEELPLLRAFDPLSSVGVGISGNSNSTLRGFVPPSLDAGLHLNGGFAGLALRSEAAPATRSRGASATKAPPGFTPADATPFEARAAFEKLRPGTFSTAVGDAERLPDNGPSSTGKPLSLLAALEPLSSPFASGGGSLFASSSRTDVGLGGGNARTAPLGEIGSKRFASFREIWADGRAEAGAAGTGEGNN